MQAEVVWRRGPLDARCAAGKQKSAVAEDRQIRDLPLFERSRPVAGGGFEQRRTGRDGNRLACRADLQRHVDVDAAVDRERDALPHVFLEPRQAGRERVAARQQVRDLIVAAVVGYRSRGDIGLAVGDLDSGAGNQRAGRILDRAQQRAARLLRPHCAAGHQNQPKAGQAHSQPQPLRSKGRHGFLLRDGN